MWSKTNKKRNCELACLTPQTCLPSYLCIGWSCILKEKFPNMLLTVLQVERCQGDDDWSLCHKKFYGVPPCDVEWGSNGMSGKEQLPRCYETGRNRSNELTVDFPCLFACKRQWKWYPLCVRVLRWCMDGKSRILAKLLWHGLAGLMSMNERGQSVELFCMIPIPASSSQQLIMLGDWAYVFVAVLQYYADRWRWFCWCPVYLFNLCSFLLFPTIFCFWFYVSPTIHFYTCLSAKLSLSSKSRTIYISLSLMRFPLLPLSSSFLSFLHFFFLPPLFLFFLACVWKIHPHLTGLELSKLSD